MRTIWLFCLATFLALSSAKAQFVLDCACIAQHPSLTVTGCQGTVPDICALIANSPNCFRSTIQPPPPPPTIVQCSQTPAAGTILGPGTHIISVTVTVAGLPPMQCAVQFTVVAPVTAFALQCAPPKTVNCDAAWNFDPPSIVNPCCPNASLPNGGVVISVVSTVTNGVCPKVITRTWQGVDNCGQIATCSQTVTVVDTVPPTINCPPNQTVNCGTPLNIASPTYSDNCTAASDMVLSVVSTVTNGVCPRVITRTWRVTDLCGNSATCSTTITVVDTVPPTINCGPNQTVNCGAQWNFSTPVIADNCTPLASLVLSIVSTTTNGACPEIVTRVWQVTDLCGNKALCTETVTIQDITPPTITCAPNKQVPCGAQWNFNQPTATDNCGNSAAGTPSVTIAVVSTVTNSLCPLSVTRTWSATDGCGNVSQCSQTVNVVGGPNSLTLNCAALAASPDLQTNACLGYVPALCAQAISLAQQNCPCPVTCTQSPAPGTPYGPGTYPITVTLSDGNGGNATCTVNFVVTAPPGGCNTNCLPPPPNMVLWLPFDEATGVTANNYAGGNNGAHFNGPIPTLNSYVANSLCFDGVNDYVEVAYYPAIGFGTGDFSVDAWVKPATLDNTIRVIVDHREISGNGVIGYSVFLGTGNTLGFQIGDGAFVNYPSTLVVPADGQWHLVAVTVNRSSPTGITFYLDGVAGVPLRDPTPYPGSITPAPAFPFRVGSRSSSVSALFPGCIDEVELFRRELTQAEIVALYNAGSLGKCKTNCLPQTRVWNTGMDGTNALAVGQPDPNYALISAPGTCTGPAQVVGNIPTQWVPNGPNSQWIGGGPSATCDPGVYHYRLCFYLPCVDGASVVGQWTSDDYGVMQLNGQTVSTTPSLQYPFGFTGWHPVALTNGLICGTNYLDFYVTNAHAVINPTGLRAELTNVFDDCCCGPLKDTSKYHSGVNANGMMPQASLDPQLVLSCAPAGVATGPAQVTNPNPFWMPNGPDSQWLAPVGNPNLPGGLYCYNYRFTLPPCTNGTPKYAVTGQWMGDDAGTVYVNGNPTGNNLPNGWAFTNWHPISITSGLVPGINFLTFYVTNAFFGDTGIRVELTNSASCCDCSNTCNVTISCW